MNTHKNWVKKRIEAGICIQCGGKKASHSKRYCKSCLVKFKNKSNKRQDALKKQGLCIQCMKESKTRICRNCMDKNNQAKNKKIEKRKELGCCIKCGKENPLPGVRAKNINKCEICVFKHAAWSYLKDSKQWLKLKEIFEKQQGKCPYTGRLITVGVNAELDHIVPKSKNGKNELVNFQWVHCDVNKMKANHFHDDFLELVCEIYKYRFS